MNKLDYQPLKNAKASTVEKAIQLLLTLSQEHRELGTTELGKKLGLHKATVSRILIQLAQYGFVYKNNETRKYWLGPAVHQLGMTMADVNFKKIMQVACAHIDNLSAAINETVALEIWLGNSTVTTYYALSDHPLKVVPQGELLAHHAAAGAKAILAYTHQERVNRLLQGELQAITENTLTDKERIKEKLSEYFKQGYSIDNEEMHLGICAIATPIFDQLKQPIAALTILVPVSRSENLLSPSLIANLKSTATTVSKELAAKRIRVSS
jgi:DNA-binding IclR family transcriptional regulator